MVICFFLLTKFTNTLVNDTSQCKTVINIHRIKTGFTLWLNLFFIEWIVLILVNKYWKNNGARKIIIWEHPFRTYAKFSEKLTFLSPFVAYLCVSGARNVSFSESFVYVLNGCSLLKYTAVTQKYSKNVFSEILRKLAGKSGCFCLQVYLKPWICITYLFLKCSPFLFNTQTDKSP